MGLPVTDLDAVTSRPAVRTSVRAAAAVAAAGSAGLGYAWCEARWFTLRHVTVPGLRPTTFFLTVLMVIQSFQVFDIVFVLTGGGPGVSTELLVTYAYRQGFGARQQGYASAIGVVIFVVVLAFTVLWWRSQRSAEDET